MKKFSELEIGKLSTLTVDELSEMNLRLKDFDAELAKERDIIHSTYNKYRAELMDSLEKLEKSNAEIISSKCYAIEYHKERYSDNKNYILYISKEELPKSSTERIELFIKIANNFQRLNGVKFKLANIILRIFGIKLL